MRIRTLLAVFLSCFAYAGLFAHEEKVKTQLTGQVLHANKNFVDLFFYDNFIDFEEKSFRLSLDGNGQFTLELFIAEAKTITFTYNKIEHTLFLEPGDQLNMVYDSYRNDAIPSFSGKGAVNNNYLAEAKKKFKRYTGAHVRSLMVKESPERFKQQLDLIRSEKYTFFKQRCLSLSTAFYAFAKADIDFWWANALLQYRWEHPAPDGAFPLNLPARYYAFLQDLSINNPLALSNIHYATFLKEFLDIKKELNSDQNYGHALYQDASRHFSGLVLEHVKANAYYTAIKRKQHSWYEKEIDRFVKYSPAERYRTIIQKALELSKTLEMGDLAPDFALTDINGRMVRLSDFRGKVVYIDFWASWCPPCVQELPYSRSLMRQFSSEDVEFVYISLDRNLPTWKSYVRNNDLKGIQLFAAQIYESDVVQQYNVKGLPSYFIIDAQGRITESRAPRPSEPRAAAAIRSAVNRTVH
ncbi:MAG: TlpA disulfide reductase family protein [Bacteroidota bacterium]